MNGSKGLVLERTRDGRRPLVDLPRKHGIDPQVADPGSASVRKACDFPPEDLIRGVDPEIRPALERDPPLRQEDLIL